MKRILALIAGSLVFANWEEAGASQPGTGPRPEAAGVQFVAEGNVDFHNYWAAEPRELPPGYTPTVSNRVHFLVVVSNACYSMRIVPARECAILYQEAGFDGATLYFLTRMNLSSPQNAPGVKEGPNVATAWLYDQQRVIYDIRGHQMGPIWLMFASGDYFRSVTNGLVEPPLTFGLFENMDFYPRPFRIPAQWTLQKAFPFLPLRVTCQDDGEVKTGPPFQDVRREPPFDAGFTNIVFRVTGTKQIEDALVPCSAEIDTYRPAPSGKPELRHYTRYRVTLNKWSKDIPATSFKPKVPGPTHFSDKRVSRTGHRSSGLGDRWPD